MSKQHSDTPDLEQLARAEEQQGIVDQQTVASAATKAEEEEADEAPEDGAIALPIEEGDFDSQPGA